MSFLLRQLMVKYLNGAPLTTDGNRLLITTTPTRVVQGLMLQELLLPILLPTKPLPLLATEQLRCLALIPILRFLLLTTTRPTRAVRVLILLVLPLQILRPIKLLVFPVEQGFL